MSLPAGTRLEPYEIVALLGAGGMGEVYRAHDTRLKRDVAVKVLRAGGSSDAALLRRLEQEARTLAALNHPNLVAIHDVGEHQGAIFLVMELLEGETLRERLRQGKLPLRRTLDYARQMAQGLAAAHAAGVVHRDLKPENIMITSEGRVKILDFGLARVALAVAAEVDTMAETSPAVVTAPGAVMGTVGYMAPEQVRGETVDTPADIFSFGAITYELLAGRRAFQAPTAAETMTAILREEPPEITAADSAAPPSLNRIVRRCLEKNPRQRFQSAADLEFALAGLSDQSSTNLSALASASGKSKPARRGWRTPLWIAIAVVITAGICALLMLDRGTPTLSASAYRTLTLNGPGYNFVPVWSADGRALAYAAQPDSASPGQVYIYRYGDPSPLQLTHMPEMAAPLAWSADGRSILLVEDPFNTPSIWSVAAVGGQPRLLMKFPAAPGSGAEAYAARGNVVAALLPQPDGKLGLAYGSPIGAPLRWYKPAPFAVAALSDFPSLAFSPDGSKLLLLLPDAQGPTRTWVLPFPPSAAHPPRPVLANLPPRDFARMTWMPDGRHILISADSQTGGSKLWEADLESGRMHLLMQGISAGYLATLSPQGNALALDRSFGKFNIVSADVHTAAVRTLIASVHNQSMPAWAADASALVYVTDRDGEDAIWIRRQSSSGVSDRELVGLAQMGAIGYYQLPALSPHAHRVAFTFTPTARGSLPQPSRLWVASVAGGPAVPLTAPAKDYQSAPCWSPDGSQIVYLSTAGPANRLMVVATTGGAAPRVFVPHVVAETAPQGGPAWSPDGKWIAFAAGVGSIHMISPDGSGERTLTRLPLNGWTFSADSRALYGTVTHGAAAELLAAARHSRHAGARWQDCDLWYRRQRR
ncbi:MAG: protein kinase domain-containing protein [Terriglobales bacterium]